MSSENTQAPEILHSTREAADAVIELNSAQAKRIAILEAENKRLISEKDALQKKNLKLKAKGEDKEAMRNDYKRPQGAK